MILNGITFTSGIVLEPPPPPPPPPTAKSFNMNPSSTDGGYISYTPGTAIQYNAFTFECWFKLLYAPTERYLTGGSSGASYFATIGFPTQTTVGYYPMPGSTGNFTVPSMALNTWHNLVVTRTPNYSVAGNPWSAPSGTPGGGYFSIAVWLNGSLATSGVVETGGSNYLNQFNNVIGYNTGAYSSGNFNGKISSLRWSSSCRYFPYTGSPGSLVQVSTISLPTSPYDTDADTVFLLNPSSSTPTDGSGLNTIVTTSGVTYDSGDSPTWS